MTLPQLAVFDVDGTLIDHDGICSARTTAALARLRALGVHTAIATGRARASIAETLDVTGPVDYVICGNGGTVTHVATDDKIFQAVLPGADVVSLIQAVRATVPGVGVAVELHDDTNLEEPGFEQRIPLRRHRIEPVADAAAAMSTAASAGGGGNDRVLGGEPDVQRVIFFHPKYDRDIFALARLVERHLNERFAVYCGVQLPLVEVMPPGQNKGVAIAQLAQHLGLDAAQVTAFGDGTNDIEMFQWVGRGVAMGPQCHPDLLAVADAVTDPVESDGVANYLDRLTI